MATINGGTALREHMARIHERVQKASQVRVGFLENADYPDGTPVAMVAAIQNFGAPAAGIPPRPFFTDMVRDESPAWPAKFGNVLKATDFDAQKSLELMGEGIAGQLREAIVDLVDPPLSPVTIARKGGTATSAKPLIDTGHMLASVDQEVE